MKSRRDKLSPPTGGDGENSALPPAERREGVNKAKPDSDVGFAIRSVVLRGITERVGAGNQITEVCDMKPRVFERVIDGIICALAIAAAVGFAAWAVEVFLVIYG